MQTQPVGKEEYHILQGVCNELTQLPGIKLAFLIFANGKMLVVSGDAADRDLSGLSALAAAGMANAIEMTKRGNISHFPILIYEGHDERILLCSIQKKGVLVVHFACNRPSGWVRFQLKRLLPTLTNQIESLLKKYAALRSPMDDASDEEIDNLNFGGL